MIFTHIKMAFKSIRSARVRSLLTMLGVIVGVSSVTVTIALGEGVKRQVLSQIGELGQSVVVVRSGQSLQADNRHITGLSFSQDSSITTLTAQDVDVVRKVPGVAAVSKTTAIGGMATSAENPNYSGARVQAVSTDILEVLGRTVQFGEYFDDVSLDAPTVVIGSDVASELFKIRDPIGRTIIIRGQEFTVRGVLTPIPATPLGFGPSGNSVVLMPEGAAKKLLGSALPVGDIQIRVDDGQSVTKVADTIRQALLLTHRGQQDFNVVTQAEYVKVVDRVFSVLTTFVAAIAAISLFVGGIGIMNIMLVSVSERTREIGVRKAVGATNRQILSQFLVESTVISVMGGIIGMIVSIVIVFVVRVTTSLHPALSPELLFSSVFVATAIGVLFGVAPAVQAARKDPIVALRHE